MQRCLRILLLRSGRIKPPRVHFNRTRYNPFMGVIIKNPAILGGTPVFRGTRVPIQTLFDYLEGGETLEDRVPKSAF